MDRLIWEAVIVCETPGCPGEGCIITTHTLIEDPELWAADWNSGRDIIDYCTSCMLIGRADICEQGVPFLFS